MDYCFEPVWKTTTPELREEITAFWMQENALPNGESSQERANQAVIIMRDSMGAIAAVSTALIRVLPRLEQPMYYYRTFCAKAHRGQHTAYAMLEAVQNTLREYNRELPVPETLGILVEIENSAIIERYPQANSPLGFNFIGYSQRRLPLYAAYFPGARLLPAARR